MQSTVNKGMLVMQLRTSSLMRVSCNLVILVFLVQTGRHRWNDFPFRHKCPSKRANSTQFSEILQCVFTKLIRSK